MFYQTQVLNTPPTNFEDHMKQYYKFNRYTDELTVDDRCCTSTGRVYLQFGRGIHLLKPNIITPPPFIHPPAPGGV